MPTGLKSNLQRRTTRLQDVHRKLEACFELMTRLRRLDPTRLDDELRMLDSEIIDLGDRAARLHTALLEAARDEERRFFDRRQDALADEVA